MWEHSDPPIADQRRTPCMRQPDMTHTSQLFEPRITYPNNNSTRTHQGCQLRCLRLLLLHLCDHRSILREVAAGNTCSQVAHTALVGYRDPADRNHPADPESRADCMDLVGEGCRSIVDCADLPDRHRSEREEGLVGSPGELLRVVCMPLSEYMS